MIAEIPLSLPEGLNPAALYASTGEDKGDDVNVALGVRYGGAQGETQKVYTALCAWLTVERCEALFGCRCSVTEFPTVHVVNLTAHGLLRFAHYDKQGKSMGRRLLEYMRGR